MMYIDITHCNTCQILFCFKKSAAFSLAFYMLYSTVQFVISSALFQNKHISECCVGGAEGKSHCSASQPASTAAESRARLFGVTNTWSHFRVCSYSELMFRIKDLE